MGFMILGEQYYRGFTYAHSVLNDTDLKEEFKALLKIKKIKKCEFQLKKTNPLLAKLS